jgi:hypothetical protein
LSPECAIYHDIKAAIKTFENMSEFKMVSTTLRDHWGDPHVDGRIILRGMFRKWERVVGTG